MLLVAGVQMDSQPPVDALLQHLPQDLEKGDETVALRASGRLAGLGDHLHLGLVKSIREVPTRE